MQRLIIVLFILSFSVSEYYVFEETLELGYTTEEFPGIQHLKELFRWIENNVHEPTRVYYQSTYEAGFSNGFDQSKFMPFAIYYTKKPSLGTFSIGLPYPTQRNIVTTGQGLFNRPIKDVTPDYIAYNLENFNAKYIVVLTEDSRNLLNNSLLFDFEKRFGRYEIYSLKNYTPGYVGPDTSDIEYIRFKNDEIEFYATNATSIDVRVQHHPYWSASVDGQKVRIQKSEFNLMRIDLPDTDRHHVILRFIIPKFPGLFLSMAGIFILLMLAMITFYKKPENLQ